VKLKTVKVKVEFGNLKLFNEQMKYLKLSLKLSLKILNPFICCILLIICTIHQTRHYPYDFSKDLKYF